MAGRAPSPDAGRPSPAKRMKLSDDPASFTAPITSASSPSSPIRSSIPLINGHSVKDDEPSNLGTALPNGPGITKGHDGDLDPSVPNGTLDAGPSSLNNVNAASFPENGGSKEAVNGNGLHGIDDSGEEEEDDREEEEEEQEQAAPVEIVQRSDMYLDTINPAILDFDFERLCSKSLTNINIYCCLVCGQYFQGRGKASWAYRHAVGENHKVWLNLETEKFYVLPEGYEVKDPSLERIVKVLNPRYEPASLPSLSLLPSTLSQTLQGQTYLPGYIGLNNIKHNDYSNVIIHLLLHVAPLRDFLLDPNTPQLQDSAKPTELVRRLSQLAKRVWSPRLFKSQASPHEFLQEVVKRSEGKFSLTTQGDPVAFLGWVLNTLHRDLGGTKKTTSSVIYRSFQGEVKIQTQEVIVNKAAARPVFDISRDTKSMKSPFLFLALDLPPTPLFQDINERKIIPQVPLSQILAKFDGQTTQESGSTLKRHHLTRLPPFLILHIKRFTKNNFVEEKNPTIVNFPLRNLSMAPYYEQGGADSLTTMYDMVANIPHESTSATTQGTATGPGLSKRDPRELDSTAWKIHLRAGAGEGDHEKWFAMQDLQVAEIRKDMVFLAETMIQVWQRRDGEPVVPTG